jgi:hypothetical protein
MDGNCFYRGFGFGYMEKLLKDKSELQRSVLEVVIRILYNHLHPDSRKSSQPAKTS